MKIPMISETPDIISKPITVDKEAISMPTIDEPMRIRSTVTIGDIAPGSILNQVDIAVPARAKPAKPINTRVIISLALRKFFGLVTKQHFTEEGFFC